MKTTALPLVRLVLSFKLQRVFAPSAHVKGVFGQVYGKYFKLFGLRGKEQATSTARDPRCLLNINLPH
jgi:hypothetical protein